MKFHKRPDYGDFQDTHRKRLALERRQRREREALPLFADEIAESQPSADEVMRRRADEWIRDEQRERDRQARNWRSIRADIFDLPADKRQQIRDRADHYGGPLNTTAYSFFYRETTGHHPPRLIQRMGMTPVKSPGI